MTIETEIDRIKQNIANCYTTLTAKGATIPAIENVANLAACIRTIPAAPSGTILHQYDRVDGKATVAGFWTDGGGQRYAVVVADAAYRSGHQHWSNETVDTPLPNYTYASEPVTLTATESATFNMNTIRSNYDLSTYPAFNSSYSNTITLDGITYNGLLPNAAELLMIWNDRTTLDTYDTTLSSYSNNSLSKWNIGGNSNSSCWSSVEFGQRPAWTKGHSDLWIPDAKNEVYKGVIPVFEIPVDENGTVITN